MSLLAIAIAAGSVGVLILALLVVRFAIKVMWKLAMIAILLVVIGIAAGATYFYLEGTPIEVPAYFR